MDIASHDASRIYELHRIVEAKRGMSGALLPLLHDIQSSRLSAAFRWP